MQRHLGFGLLIALLVWSATPRAAEAKDYWNDETPAQRAERMAWWQEARFGMFIHWGLYAIPEGRWQGKETYSEWIRHKAKIPLDQYDRFRMSFNPIRFEADAWARMAREAGMKYLIITSKHHDGFCLWPSAQTDFDVASTPFDRDILDELKAACDRQGIRLGFYHSIMDWHHPDYVPRRDWEKDRGAEGADLERYIGYMKTQLKELVERYDPVVLWFDGEWEGTWTHEHGIDLYDYVRSLKPEIIINNRVDKGRKGMQGLTIKGDFRGDFGTPEQEIPATGIPGTDWESCMTMNSDWGWNAADTKWKSTEDLVRKLVDIASKGGNFLLNIGPKPDGTFPEKAVERLSGMGDWMAQYGGSIYGTEASPIAQPSWGRITLRRDGETSTLFLHVFDWPADGNLPVAIANEAIDCVPMGILDRPFVVDSGAGGLTARLEGPAPDPIDSVIVLRVRGAVKPIEAQ
jgi:alpha-L-fucosidase